MMAQYGQPWSNVNLKKVALNLLRDELVLELDRGVFSKAIPKMVIYVPDAQDGRDNRGIFVADEDGTRLIRASSSRSSTR